MSVTSLRAKLLARAGRFTLDAELDTGPGPLVLVGPNGAGKSTLLATLLGARPAERGCIEVDGTLLLDSEREINVPLEERRLGYVPQDYALFPHMTVGQNIAFALASSSPRLTRKDREQAVEAALRDLQIEAFALRLVTALSGGEKQRVALARALVVKPRALLLDEPLAALDVYARCEVRNLLVESLESTGLPSIVVTHDAEDARALGRRVAVLERGRITQLGSWEELCSAPATAFVQCFVAQARG
jgi:molybdate transport system ATP-binding protein